MSEWRSLDPQHDLAAARLGWPGKPANSLAARVIGAGGLNRRLAPQYKTGVFAKHWRRQSRQETSFSANNVLLAGHLEQPLRQESVYIDAANPLG